MHCITKVIRDILGFRRAFGLKKGPFFSDISNLLFHVSLDSPRFPEVDEVVMVQVKSIAEMGAYVSLLEYNNIEGMIGNYTLSNCLVSVTMSNIYKR